MLPQICIGFQEKQNSIMISSLVPQEIPRGQKGKQILDFGYASVFGVVDW